MYQLSVGERRVAVALDDFVKENSRMPGSTEIFEQVAMARGHVVIAMQRLEEKGLITRPGGTGPWHRGQMRRALSFLADGYRLNPDALKPRPRPVRPETQRRLALTGRTRFLNRVVDRPDYKPLKRGGNNSKLGRRVTKGKLKGARIYSLTLEERATCPSSCKMYESCYGNNMSMAKRYASGKSVMIPLADQLKTLCSRKELLLVRLHVLGDFDSVEYVDFWRSRLERHPTLFVFGFTAREPHDPIGAALMKLRQDYPDRWFMRTSGFGEEMASNVAVAGRQADGFHCPEQSGKVATCGECGACWGTKKNVLFAEH